MSLLEKLYEYALRSSRPLLTLARRSNVKLARGLEGRTRTASRFEAWARRDEAGPCVWVHAPSVGEALMAKAIIGALRQCRPDVKVAFTFFSPSAERIAQDVGADVAAYLPWDVTRDMRRSLSTLRPRVVAFVRTEIWPILVREAKAEGCGVMLVNGVLSEGSGRLRAPARTLLRPAYRRLDRVGAVSEADAVHFTRLGVLRERIAITGDARMDQALARADAVDRQDATLARLGNGARVIVAGSTWPADEARIIPAFASLRSAHACRLVIAPHEPTPDHLARLEHALAHAGLEAVRYGAIEAGERDPADVVIVDRTGILASLYAAATLAYVGGGFGRAGLHAVVEPAALGVPVLFGPHHGNTRDAAVLESAGGGVTVRDEHALRERIASLLGAERERSSAGAAARAFVEAHRGGAARNAALIAQVLDAAVH